jgi:hypothetical protein
MKYLVMLVASASIAGCTKPMDLKENTTVKKKVFYRIKQVDRDGVESYSPVVYVVEENRK